MSLNKFPGNRGPSRINRRPEPLTGSLSALERERARLEEEVLQLKAAVSIWTEVFRQSVNQPGEAQPGEIEAG